MPEIRTETKRSGKIKFVEVRIKGLYKKREWYYYAIMRNGLRSVVALQTQNFEEALAKVNTLKTQPNLLAADEARLEVERFAEYKLSHKEYSRFSFENKRGTLLRFAKWLGNTPLKKVDSNQIKRFYSIERQRVKDLTAAGYMMTIRSFFSYLMTERKVVRVNPVPGVKLAKFKECSRVVFCSYTDRDLILNGLNSVPPTILPTETVKMLGFVFYFGFEAGARRNDIIEARPNWFDMHQKSIHIQKTDTFDPKDRESRHIPMTDSLHAFLMKYPFTGTWCIAPEKVRGKSRYRYDFIRPFKIYLAYLTKIHGQDFRYVTPHVMRHTFATLLIYRGASLTKVSLWMGDDPRVTERHYAHLVKGDPEINLLRCPSGNPSPPSSNGSTPL